MSAASVFCGLCECGIFLVFLTDFFPIYTLRAPRAAARPGRVSCFDFSRAKKLA